MKNKSYAGIDEFRFVAALFVIAIHVSPFSVWNEEADFLITYCLGRVAVPFFFMTTGYFVLAPYIRSGFRKKRSFYKYTLTDASPPARTGMHYGMPFGYTLTDASPPARTGMHYGMPFGYIMKNIGLYLAASLFYLPASVYSGNFPHSAGELAKQIFFDGTFYHLWYFPAVITGCVVVTVLMKKSVKTAVCFSAVTYGIGLLGDSYYGVTERIPLLRTVYDGIFQVSSYTRNGIFFAPVYLILGALLAAFPLHCQKNVCRLGLLISLLLMLLEGDITYRMGLQRHNSMYLFLIPVMYFLFQLLLMIPGKAPGWLRKGTMLIYILHPAVIILVRGIGKTSGLTRILVDHTFIQYVLVCVLSVGIACGVNDACEFVKGKIRGVIMDG